MVMCSCCFHSKPEPFTPVSLARANLSRSSSSMATANTMHPVCNTTIAGSAFNNGTITGAIEDLQTQPSFENQHQVRQFQRGDHIRYESDINFQAELENFLREFPPQSNYHEPQNQSSNFVQLSQSEQSNIQLSQDQQSNLERLPQNQQSNFVYLQQNQPSSSFQVSQNQSSTQNQISTGQRNPKRGAPVDCFLPQQQRPRLQQIHPQQGPFNHQPTFSSSQTEYRPPPGPHEPQLLIQNKLHTSHYVPELPIRQIFPLHGETCYVQPLREINIQIPQQVDPKLMGLFLQPSTSFQQTQNRTLIISQEITHNATLLPQASHSLSVQTHQSSLSLPQEQMPPASLRRGPQSFQPRLQLDRQQEPHISQQWIQARMPQSSQSRQHQQMPQSSRSRPQQASQPYRQAPLEENILREHLRPSPELRLQRDRRQLLEDYFQQYCHPQIVPFDRSMPPNTLGLGGLQEVPKVTWPAKNTEPDLKLVLQQKDKDDELDIEYEPSGKGYFRIYHIFDAGYLSPLGRSEFPSKVADRLQKEIRNLLEKNYYFERHFNIVLSQQVWNLGDSDESGILNTDEDYYLTFSRDKIAKYLLSFKGKYNEVPPEDGIFSEMLPRAYSMEGPEQALSADDIVNKNWS